MAYYFTAKLREEIGKNIEKARRNRKKKQVEVAEEAGITTSYYNRIENGTVNPSLEKLYKIIKVLNVKSSDIFPF